MKIAICIQGLIGRNWSPSVYEDFFYKTLIKPNLDHEIDIFLQTWTNVDSNMRYSPCHNDEINNKLINKNQIINLYKPKDYIIEEFNYKDFAGSSFTGNFTDKYIHSAFIQSYTWYKTMLMCEKYGNYDVGIRTRFDVEMTHPLNLNNYNFNVDYMYGDISCSNHNEYGVNPDLFFGPYEIFKQINYFKNISDFLKEGNNPCSIESFNEYHLRKDGIKFKQCEFFYPPDFIHLFH